MQLLRPTGDVNRQHLSHFVIQDCDTAWGSSMWTMWTTGNPRQGGTEGGDRVEAFTTFRWLCSLQRHVRCSGPERQCGGAAREGKLRCELHRKIQLRVVGSPK
jgi:hypothetical protein